MRSVLASLAAGLLISGCGAPYECDARGHIIIDKSDSPSRQQDAMVRNLQLDAARAEAESGGRWFDPERVKRAEGCGS
jgi:hypothetical protein